MSKENDFPMPVFTQRAGYFETKFIAKVFESVNADKIQNITLSTTYRILERIKTNPYTTVEELASEFNLTRDGVNYQIRKLKNENKIERVGGKNGGYYKIL